MTKFTKVSNKTTEKPNGITKNRFHSSRTQLNKIEVSQGIEI